MFILGCISSSSSSTCLCGQTWSGCRVRLEVMDGEALCRLGLCWRQMVCSCFPAPLTHSSKVEHFAHLRNLHVPCRPVTSAIKKGFTPFTCVYTRLSPASLWPGHYRELLSQGWWCQSGPRLRQGAPKTLLGWSDAPHWGRTYGCGCRTRWCPGGTAEEGWWSPNGLRWCWGQF